MEEKKASEGSLNFSTVQPLIDMSFWLKFTAKKLDEWKLECPKVDIQGTISMPMSKNISSNLVIDENGFGQKTKSTGGLLEFNVSGKFIHFNTIEDY
jgi:hypothetical protein